MDFVSLTDHVGYIEADPRFLCPKIGVVHGAGGTLYFDTGTSKKQLLLLEQLDFRNPSYLAISHFHEDHIAQFPAFSFCNVYGSKTTSRYVRVDEVVEDRVSLNLGDVDANLIRTPSSHSKGSLLLLAERVLFVGDALYPNAEGRYDRSSTFELVQTLESLDFKRIVYGHEAGDPGETKEKALAYFQGLLKTL